MHNHSKTSNMMMTAALLALLLGAAVPAAHGLSFDGSGNVTDWGISPFPNTGTAAGNHFGWAPSSSSTFWTEENNYSTISYPHGVGNYPSPGGNLGEMFDLEAMFWRKSTGGDALQVLVVTSMGHSYNGSMVAGVAKYSWGQKYYRLGDLFIDTGVTPGYDFAVASTDWAGYSETDPKLYWWAYLPDPDRYHRFERTDAAGTLYTIDYRGEALTEDSQAATVVNGKAPGGELPNGSNVDHLGYGAYPNIEPQVRPWVVIPENALGKDTNAATLQTGMFSYGSELGGGYNHGGADEWFNENYTWFFEYTIPLASLGLSNNYDIGNISLHITNECGNDLLNGAGTPGGGGLVPEPTTMLGGLMGLGALGRYLRRRRA